MAERRCVTDADRVRSDLHAGPTTHPAVLDEAFAALAAATPSRLLGGDYVFLFAGYIEAIEARLRRSVRHSGSTRSSAITICGRMTR